MLLKHTPFILALTLLAVIAPPLAAAPAAPKPAVRLSGGEQRFNQTSRCMHGLFLGYWQSHGGLAQFGYPITDELTEDGRTVQYTERVRLDCHPGYRYATNAVVLGVVG